MTTRPPTPPRDYRVTAPWVRVQQDRGMYGRNSAPLPTYAATLMDGKVGVSGAIDSCPWSAAARAVGYAIGRGVRG